MIYKSIPTIFSILEYGKAHKFVRKLFLFDAKIFTFVDGWFTNVGKSLWIGKDSGSKYRKKLAVQNMGEEITKVFFREYVQKTFISEGGTFGQNLLFSSGNQYHHISNIKYYHDRIERIFMKFEDIQTKLNVPGNWQIWTPRGNV